MASRKQEMQLLLEQRDQLVRERDAITNKIAGLELAISLLSGDEQAAAPVRTDSRGRPNVKGAVLDLLREVGTTGINATTAVEVFRRRGLELDRGSVSSLLSRLKRDDVVCYDGDRYRLKEFAKPIASVTFIPRASEG